MWQQVPTSKADTIIDDFEMIDDQQQQPPPTTNERSFLLSSNTSEYYSDYADAGNNLFGTSTLPATFLQTQTRPVCFRVLFMGNTESIGNINRSKTLVLRKLSEVIASLLPRSCSTNTPTNDLGTTDFREKTHNVVFLDAFDTSPIETYEDNGLHVIEADFTDNNDDDQYERRLINYVNTHDVNLVVYFYYNRKQQPDERNMAILEQLSGRMPIWPLLVYSSIPGGGGGGERPHSATGYHHQRRHRSPVPPTANDSIATLGQKLADKLARHQIQTIDLNLTGVNPEEHPHFASTKITSSSTPPSSHNNDLILTVDQFATIHRDQVAVILQRWRTDHDNQKGGNEDHHRWWWLCWLQKQQRRSLPFSSTGGALAAATIVGLLLLLFGTRLTTLWAQRRSTTMDLPKEPVKMRLNPMWDVVDEETLRQLFVVEVDPERKHDAWKEQTLVVVLETDHLAEKEFRMTYEPGTQYKYVVDVPSPCLIHNTGDIPVHIVWRYQQDESTRLERTVANYPVLSMETCQPVYQRHVAPECAPRTALSAVRRRASSIEWKLLFGKLKHEFKKLAHDMSNACQNLFIKLLS